MERCVIVGGGHGGAQTALMLRQQGFAGSITILSDEADAPYQRPPLSKDYLSGASSFDKIKLRPDNYWADKGIDVRLSARVVNVDASDHCLTLESGEKLSYDWLVWAAGGEARRLACEGHDTPGIHHIRKRADVDALIAELATAKQIVVVGGGYIGLEAASSLVKQGKAVTLVESADRVLSRVAGEPLSRFFERKHGDQGVLIRLSTNVRRIVSANGRVAGVMLDGGEVLYADIVIVGIGLVPNSGPLLDAGAICTNGIEVDEYCRTSLPDIFAIGDCAAHLNSYAGGSRIRLESVQNAQDQAAVVAKAICGNSVAYDALPWFWSSQYDVRLQTVGLSQGHDQTILRGAIGSGSFSILYLRAGRVIALDCVNAVKDYTQGRALLLAGDQAPIEDLGDALKPLRVVAT